MQRAKKIVFTGGGSAGHVTPNIALIQAMQALDWEVAYIGSTTGIEKSVIGKLGIPYFPIQTGKLRRYFSWQNFIDPFKIVYGFCQAFYHCLRLRPNVVFSKGGFVAFPVVVAAWLLRIPVLAHESDFSPGLATRLSVPFVKKVCVTFDDAVRHFKQADKIKVTGTPLRPALWHGNAVRGKAFCHFSDDKKVILITGGGLGAVTINKVVRQLLPALLQRFNVIHLCGHGKLNHTLVNMPGYCQFEYVHDELPDLFAAADLVISRAGANAIYELLALQKPHLLIPLPRHASRGDQIQNARHFAEKGLSRVLNEEDLTTASLEHEINELLATREVYQRRLDEAALPDSVDAIRTLLLEYAR